MNHHHYRPVPRARAAFQGHWMAPGSFGSGVPAWLLLEDGYVALMVPGESASGYVDLFRVPVHQAAVSSAAQRITVTVGGTGYPVLARPHGPYVAMGLTTAGAVAGAMGADGPRMASAGGRMANIAADARAFSLMGGPEFLAAVRAEGAPVRRMGYPALLGLGLVLGVLVVVLINVVMFAVL